ncbi:MAG: zinc-binding dehydrogenase [Betaproteobacteria bacterium]|nr:zinc-binding dehydrogenase [Betaproteobacteria bacterium]
MPLPEGLTLREAMVLGSSGLTAAHAFDRLVTGGVKPESGPIVVTGATGGVGSLAIDIFSSHGYAVSAVTGKPDAAGYLRDIGASEVLTRASLLSQDRLLGRGRWAGAVDNVGGEFLDQIARTMLPHGRIAVCGLAAGAGLKTTVLPFILRAVDFLGINVGRTFPMAERLRLWNRLASDLKPRHMDRIINAVTLPELPAVLGRMFEASVTGRVVVEIGEGMS